MVTFFANGGKDIDPIVVAQGEQATLPVPEKSGFIFLGWFDNEDLEGEPLPKNIAIENDLTLFAKWERLPVTVEFVSGVEGIFVEALQIAYGSNVETLPTPTREGYVFEGWFDNAQLEGSVVESLSNLTDNTVLHAKWSRIVLATISFEVNGGNALLPVEIFAGDAPSVTLPTPQKEGCAFAGWFTNAECSGTAVASPYATQGNQTLYAKWLNTIGYKVNHSLQDVLGNGYSLFYSENAFGFETLSTNAEAKSFEGFVAQSFLQAEILSDGTTVVNIFYNRKEFDFSATICGVEVAKEKVRFGEVVDLSKYSLFAHTVLGWYVNGATEAAAADFQCIVTEDLHCVAKETFAEITSFEQLLLFAENNVEQLVIAEDITVSQTVYVTCDTVMYSTKNVKLTRAPYFDGEMFVVGQDKNGQNTQLVPRHSSLTLMPTQSLTGGFNTLTIDGNKDALLVDVKGSAIFVANGAVLNIYDGAIVTNCKKSGNVLTQAWLQGFTSPETVGGAAIVLSSSELNVFGGEISNCETAGSLYGGAIYNFGILNMRGGLVQNNTSSYGGAVYSNRYIYVYDGTFKNNAATEQGGAIFCENTRYTNTTLYASNFVGNTAKRGGAIYFSMDSGLTIYQGTNEDGSARFTNVFDGNSATQLGGAICSGGSFNCLGGYFKNNTAMYGSAIYHYYLWGIKRIFTLNNAKFESNNALQQGTVYVGYSGTLVQGDNVFENNSVGSGEEVVISEMLPM